MGFFDELKKVNKALGTATGVAALTGATAAGIAKSVSVFKKNKHQREMDNKKFDLEVEKLRADNEIKMRQLEQKERLEMMNAQVNLQKQQLMNQDVITRMQLETQAKIQLTGMNNQADIEKTQIRNQSNIQMAQVTSQAAVDKAQAMYGSGKIQTNGMFVDSENGIITDNRNVVNVNSIPFTAYPNYNSSLMFGAPINSQIISQGSSMEKIQKKLLDANKLWKSGAITEEEFLNMKQRILMGNF